MLLAVLLAEGSSCAMLASARSLVLILQLWPLTYILDRVMLKCHTKYLTQRSVHLKVIISTHIHIQVTNLSIRPTKTLAITKQPKTVAEEI